ncbi:hypothetical protein GZ77_24225 [Endozoicomonas montiporae]|uniref:Signal transduction histidine kinase internal region domain-containing protein n=2 Tax=Endozoicomonas montiporae TaxID=1027273 RepID=A0A081MZL0_9GAMM|nr:histidine kinase [Endozoicomonas montiporae]AMO54684.1 histidine kinase internal region [Endozoicomonas montiporae CL-33]KEQ11633.1 hypothetical protein GZ77_24225 [Endozoicomonas montiporae]
MPHSALDKQNSDHLFIPDLCHTSAVFILVLVAELFVLIQVLAFPGSHGFDWNRLAITSLFVQWIALCSAAVLCRLRLLLKHSPITVIVSAVLATVLIITLTVTLLAQWFLWKDAFLLTFPDWTQLLRHAFIALIMTAMLLRYFYIQHEASRQTVANANARFQALQARIRPHFLFNSMNIIASLIHIDQDKAEEAVEDLSDLFRSSLQEAGDLIALSREIELCKGYLRIEKHRLGERLNSEWRLHNLPEPLPVTLTIPPLTLQPVIENAVYHGIQPRENGGTVSVDIALGNDKVTIRVQNPVPDNSEQAVERGNRLALDNIRSRLQLLYGHHASIDTHLTLNNGTEIYETIISYPENKLSTA